MVTSKDRIRKLDKKKEAFCFKSEWDHTKGFEWHNNRDERGFRLLRHIKNEGHSQYEDLGFFNYDELNELKKSLLRLLEKGWGTG